VENKGMEIELATKVFSTKKLRWNSNLVVTIPRNRLVSFPGLAATSYAQTYKEGASLNAIRGYDYLGVDPVSGVYTFEDLDKDGKVTFQNDYRITKRNTDPKIYGGLKTGLAYKGWQLDGFFEFRKQEGLNYLATQVARLPGMAYNQPDIVLNRWLPTSADAPIQRYTSNFSSAAFAASILMRNADAIFGDASFIRLRNASLSYSLSDRLLAKTAMESCRIYIQGQNVGTFTRYKGADPENQNLYALPPLRAITGGIQLTF
jgi:TonB-dependent starch-binding outer membrane protein SusC